ncbi:MAG: MFS transporter [Synergistales bacterium]|nr:MFS transporter [Synergistales bacterium]
MTLIFAVKGLAIIGPKGNGHDNGALRYRWYIWGIMVCSFVVAFFHRLAPGVLREELTNAFDLTATSFGTLASMYFYAYMIMQIPVGMLADSLGARITVSIGMFMTALGSLLFGMARTSPLIFLGRFIVGIGVSTVFVCILKIQSRWFREREFATMSGLTLLVGNSGGILAQTPLAVLVTIISWRTVFLFVALVSFLMGVLSFLIIRNDPSEMDFEPVNEMILPESTSRGDLSQLSRAAGNVLAHWPMWPAMIFYAFINGTWLAFLGAWGVSYLTSVYGLPKSQAADFIIWGLLGLIVGSLSVGWISDKLGKRKLPMLTLGWGYTIIWGILVFANGGRPPLGMIKPLFFLMGFCFTCFVLSLSVVKELNLPRYTGVATAVYNTAGFLGVPLVATLIGYIIDRLSPIMDPVAQYHYAFLLIFSMMVTGTLLLIFLPETNCENIHRKGSF